MRELTDHIVSGDQAVQLQIEVVDEPGQGGANHAYRIMLPPPMNPQENVQTQNCYSLDFQNGPIKEFGVNGITGEALMAIQIDRLRSFQSGPFACRENALALTHLEESLMWLQRRTVARIKRRVEGTHQK